MTTDITPPPAPMSAEAMLSALIKANKTERQEVQDIIDTHTLEAQRLDAIKDGLEAALRAVRYPASAAASRSA